MSNLLLLRRSRFPKSAAALALSAVIACAGPVEAGTKKRVVTEFTASLATIAGTPFGLDSSDRTSVVSGFFVYNPDTADANPSTQRGDYQQVDGYFEITLPDGSKITGSATPFVQIEDLSSDTFRFIDGPRTVGNQGGIMSLDGVPDGDIQLSIAISGSGSSFANDSLPDPLPFGTGNIPPHTFSLKEGDTNDTVLLQFVTMASGSAGITVTESGGSTAVKEGGANDEIEVALTGTPVENVTVTLTPADSNIDLGNGAGVAVELTFAPGNANTNQMAIVSADDDQIAEGVHATDVTITASSADPAFNGLAGPPVTVAITDNDGNATPAPTIKDTWTEWYQKADSDFATYAAIGDFNFANAFYYYNKAIGDYLFHTAHGRTAEALYWFHIWVGVYHYYYFQIIPGTLPYYYLFNWYAYAFYYYYLTLGDTNTANEQFNFYYSQALGFL